LWITIFGAATVISVHLGVNIGVNHRLQEVSDKRRLAYNQYEADWTYLVALRTKKLNDLDRLRDMQLADKRAAEI
jgi:hypothetical protein